MKVRCRCRCHTDPGMKHVVPCCNNGWIQFPGLGDSAHIPVGGEDEDDIYDAVREYRDSHPEPAPAPTDESELWRDVFDIIKSNSAEISWFNWQKAIAELQQQYTLSRRSEQPDDDDSAIWTHSDIIDMMMEWAKICAKEKVSDFPNDTAEFFADRLKKKGLINKGQPEAVAFAEWIRTFFPHLSVENGQWCIESQVSSAQLYQLFKQQPPRNPFLPGKKIPMQFAHILDKEDYGHYIVRDYQVMDEPEADRLFEKYKNRLHDPSPGS